MTAKELAEMLSGRKYGMEITKDEEQQAADAGLVVAYGYSDDNVEFRGAIDDEVGSFDGGTVYLTKDGILEGPDCSCAEDCECPYFAKEREKAKTIKAVWHKKGGPCWTFETDIPHETFTIMEDGAPCIALMQELVGEFEDYLDFMNIIPESEEERFAVNFSYFHIVQRLMLWKTMHSGGTSTIEKCRALGFDPSDIVSFEDERDNEETS